MVYELIKIYLDLYSFLSVNLFVTRELIGLEYLFNQTNEELLPMHPDEEVVEDDDGEDVGRREGEDVEDPTQPPPEFGVSPASSRRASSVSSQQPVPQHVSKNIFISSVSFYLSSSLPVPSTRCRPHTSKAPATVSRAPDSPPPTSIHRTSTAPATVSRAPDSPRDDTPDGGTLAGDEEVKDVEDVDLREESDEEHTGRRPGYDRVKALGNYLLKLRGDDHLMSSRDAKQIVKLWNKLDPYDQQVRRPARHQEKLTKGRFKARGTSLVVPGIESTQRYVHSTLLFFLDAFLEVTQDPPPYPMPTGLWSISSVSSAAATQSNGGTKKE
nr:uncharacterized protein LOC129265316 [Lytechinus pictus]